MKYVLMFWGMQAQAPDYTPEQRAAAVQEWFSLVADMKAAGVYVDNYGFAPDKDVTTVRVRDGKTTTTEGPSFEVAEKLNGYYLLDCTSLDEAISWAAKIPYARFASVEVRPAITYVREENAQAAPAQEHAQASGD
jgi:hypothetical protein